MGKVKLCSKAPDMDNTRAKSRQSVPCFSGALYSDPSLAVFLSLQRLQLRDKKYDEALFSILNSYTVTVPRLLP